MLKENFGCIKEQKQKKTQKAAELERDESQLNLLQEKQAEFKIAGFQYGITGNGNHEQQIDCVEPGGIKFE